MKIDIDEVKMFLSNIELNNKFPETPEEMSIGIGVKFADEDDNTINLMVGVFMFDKEGNTKDVETARAHVELTYTIIHKLNLQEISEKEREEIEDYIWKIEYPEVRETVRYICSRIGVPNILIPFKSKKANG